MERVVNTVYRIPISTYTEELYITLKNKDFFGHLFTLTISPGEESILFLDIKETSGLQVNAGF